MLGIWGDPAQTGKPAGDDLISGKPTVVLAIAAEQLRSPAAKLALQRVGSAEFSPPTWTCCASTWSRKASPTAVERLIAGHVSTALPRSTRPCCTRTGSPS